MEEYFCKEKLFQKIIFYEKGKLRNKKGFYRLSNKNLRANHKVIASYEGKNTLNPYIWGSNEKVDYGQCEFDGKFNLIEPTNNKNNRQIIECLTDVQARNDFFGNYNLPKGNEFQFNIENSLGGINDTKGTDDLWMSITKINQLISNGTIKKANFLLKQISSDI